MKTTEYFAPQTLGQIYVPYVGGFSKWYYQYSENVNGFPGINPRSQYLTGEPVLKAGKSWLGPVTVPKSMVGFIESTARTKAGLYYKTKFQASMPGSDMNVDVNFDNLAHHQVIIAAKARSGGYWKVFGTNKKGFTVDIETDSGMGNRPVFMNKLVLTYESPFKNPVLASFSGDNSTPATLPPGVDVTIYKPDSMEIDLNTNGAVDGGDTIIDWIPSYVTRFGNFPQIEVWTEVGDGYEKAPIPIQATGTPPTSFIIRNGGAPGIIKII